MIHQMMPHLSSCDVSSVPQDLRRVGFSYFIVSVDSSTNSYVAWDFGSCLLVYLRTYASVLYEYLGRYVRSRYFSPVDPLNRE